MTNTNLPKHIAIIMDGNRRWAKKNGLAIATGHRRVAEKIIENLSDHCVNLGIKYLTLWAFSTENWRRDQKEISDILNLFREIFTKNLESLSRKNVRIETIGDLSAFPDDIQQSINQMKEKTKSATGITVIFALNYGGRDEILRAANKCITEGSELITEEKLLQNLDSGKYPAPDLLIRPGGEKRLSGFLTWQAVYSELYFSDTLMPDFDSHELDLAIDEFQQRQRRFGR